MRTTVGNPHCPYQCVEKEVADDTTCAGEWVRYAPNRVLINTKEGMHGKTWTGSSPSKGITGAKELCGLSSDVYGHGAPVTKGHSYKVLSARAPNTLTMQDKTQHSRRRHVISQAFSESSLRKFEPVIQSRIDRFFQVLRGRDLPAGQWSEPSDMAKRCG